MTENICLGREPRRFGLLDWRRHARARPKRCSRRFNIESTCAGRCMSFSTAVQQMVAIARAVGFDAKLVIMDEPTSSLDEREVAVLFGVIRQLKARGRVRVFVSHKLDELYAVCDRVTIMRDGRTVRGARHGEAIASSISSPPCSAATSSTGRTARPASATRARRDGRQAAARGRGPCRRPPACAT